MKTLRCPSCDELLPQVAISCAACGETLLSLQHEAKQTFIKPLYDFLIKSAPEETWLDTIKQKFGPKRSQEKKNNSKTILEEPLPESDNATESASSEAPVIQAGLDSYDDYPQNPLEKIPDEDTPEFEPENELDQETISFRDVALREADTPEVI